MSDLVLIRVTMKSCLLARYLEDYGRSKGADNHRGAQDETPHRRISDTLDLACGKTQVPKDDGYHSALSHYSSASSTSRKSESEKSELSSPEDLEGDFLWSGNNVVKVSPRHSLFQVTLIPRAPLTLPKALGVRDGHVASGFNLDGPERCVRTGSFTPLSEPGKSWPAQDGACTDGQLSPTYKQSSLSCKGRQPTKTDKSWQPKPHVKFDIKDNEDHPTFLHQYQGYNEDALDSKGDNQDIPSAWMSKESVGTSTLYNLLTVMIFSGFGKT